MKRKLLLLPIALLTLASCTSNITIGGASIGGSSSTSSDSVSASFGGEGSENTPPVSTPVEYISQEALNSLKGKIKFSASFTSEYYNGYYNDEQTYGISTKIFDGDNYYQYHFYDYENKEDITNEIYARNTNEKIGILSLNNQNQIVTTLNDNNWGDYCANPLGDLKANNFVKQPNGTYLATNIDDRANLCFAAFNDIDSKYTYYDDVINSILPYVYITVENNLVVRMHCEYSYSPINDYFLSVGIGAITFNGDVEISEHGTAEAMTFKPKPTVAEHAELESALQTLVDAPNLSITTEFSRVEDTNENLSTMVRKEVFLPSVYYLNSPFYQSSGGDYAGIKKGYIKNSDNFEYYFEKQDDYYYQNDFLDIPLQKACPKGTLKISEETAKIKWFKSFSVSLLEYKGDGIFEAYNDTTNLISDNLIIEGYYWNHLPDVSNLVYSVKDGKLDAITYSFNHEGYGACEAKITFSTNAVAVPTELSETIEATEMYATLNALMGGAWVAPIKEGLWDNGYQMELNISNFGLQCYYGFFGKLKLSGTKLSFVLSTCDDDAISTIEYIKEEDKIIAYFHVKSTSELGNIRDQEYNYEFKRVVSLEVPEDVKEIARNVFDVELNIPFLASNNLEESETNYSVDEGTLDGKKSVRIEFYHNSFNRYIATLLQSRYEVITEGNIVNTGSIKLKKEGEKLLIYLSYYGFQKALIHIVVE